MMVVMVSLLLMAYTNSMLLPVICGSLALLFFIGYSLWFWIKNPGHIIINKMLSAISGWFVIYFFIVGAMEATNKWWYITPIALAVTVLFISSVNYKDETIYFS